MLVAVDLSLSGSVSVQKSMKEVNPGAGDSQSGSDVVTIGGRQYFVKLSEFDSFDVLKNPQPVQLSIRQPKSGVQQSFPNVSCLI